MQGERRNEAGSSDLGASRMLPARNIIAPTVPARPSGLQISSAAQPGPGIAVTQPPSGSVSLSSVLADVNSQIRNLVGNMQGAHMVQSGSLSYIVHIHAQITFQLLSLIISLFRSGRN